MKPFTFVLLLALSFCARAQEPLQSFRAIVEQCNSAFKTEEKTTVRFNPRTGQWSKLMVIPGEVVYDVRKTDSLVSPFTAVMNIGYFHVVFTSADEALARDADLSTQQTATSRHESKITFAMQDGAWIPKVWTERSSLKIAGSDSFDNGLEIKIPFTDKSKIQGPKRHCIP